MYIVIQKPEHLFQALVGVAQTRVVHLHHIPFSEATPCYACFQIQLPAMKEPSKTLCSTLLRLSEPFFKIPRLLLRLLDRLNMRTANTLAHRPRIASR